MPVIKNQGPTNQAPPPVEASSKAKNILQQAGDFLSDRFNLQRDQEREDMVVSEIRRGVEFRGINTWVLVFAIMVAAIGLNVNSTAVVIGAMLISPLMGPIMGVGLGIGISDVLLIKKSAKNLGVMVAICVITSAIYFAISPLQEDNSELLGRTSPTLWDVFIAFFGGCAGIVAAASKEKGNVVPGVAIATALMPPLCTAGYGIATQNWSYFAGAFYLFSINTVFICFSTLIFVRFLRFHEVAFISPEMKKRVRTIIAVFVIAMVIPSIYIARGLVMESIFEQRAATFVEKAFQFPATNILKTDARYQKDQSVIEVWLRGEQIDANTIANLTSQLPAHGLEDCTLKVVQDFKQMSADEIKSEVFERIVTSNLDSLQSKNEKINYLTKELATIKSQVLPLEKLAREAAQFDPQIEKLSIQPTVFFNKNGKPIDTVHIALTTFSAPPKTGEITRFANWLKVRLESDSLRVVVD